MYSDHVLQSNWWQGRFVLRTDIRRQDKGSGCKSLYAKHYTELGMLLHATYTSFELPETCRSGNVPNVQKPKTRFRDFAISQIYESNNITTDNFTSI